jgi:carboxymethylenebutenolidase
VLGHFGTNDQFISVEDAKSLEAELQQAGVEAAFEFYEGAGHAFFADHDRLGTYHEEHARSAWGKTVDFFKQHLSRDGS